MVTVHARVIQIEREHARPDNIIPIAAAQRKRRPAPVFLFMCHGVHPAFRRATNGFHEVFVFCLTWTAWKRPPLSPWHWHKARRLYVSGSEGRAARKPTFALEFTRGLLSRSANTPALAWSVQWPPRKGSAGSFPNVTCDFVLFSKGANPFILLH